MTGAEMKLIANRLGLTQARLGEIVGRDRATVNRMINGKLCIPPAIDLSMRFIQEKNADGWRTGPRRKRNLQIPPALRDLCCPTCKGVLWWSYSKGVERRGIQRRIYPAVCKTHAENRSACHVTTLYFDAKGNLLEDIPKFAPREFKSLNFQRPLCPICKREMKTGKTLKRTEPDSRGRVVERQIQGFYCDGRRRQGEPKHRAEWAYYDDKGNRVDRPPRRRQVKWADLPVALRRDWPRCPTCGQRMGRNSTYVRKSGEKIFWFLCRAHNKQLAFDHKGRPHKPYRFDGRPQYKCPECGRRLTPGRSARSRQHPNLRRFYCRNSAAAPHQRRNFWVNPRNGQVFFFQGKGSRWKLMRAA